MTNTSTWHGVLSKPYLLALFVGQFISQSGNRIYAMASLWMAYQLTHSTVAMSAVEAVSLIAVLVVGNFGGIITDRTDPLWAMICVDIFSAITLGLIPVLYFAGHLTVWDVIVTSVLLTGASMLFTPALQGIIPQMTTREELVVANGMLDLTDRLSKILGPAVVGALMVLATLVDLFTIDALTFVVSAISLVYVRIQWYKRSTTVKTFSQQPLVTLSLDSWKTLMKTPWLRTVTVVRSLNNGFWALYTIGSPIFVQSRFQLGIGAWGLILAAYGAGQVFGNVLAVQFSSYKNSLRTFIIGWTVIGLSFVGYAVSSTIAIAVSCIFFAGVGGPIAHVAINTRIGLDVAQNQIVGVFRIQKMMISLLNGIGIMAAGVVYKFVDARTGILCAGLGMTAVMVTTVILEYIDRHRRRRREGLLTCG
ncbi:MFS transporter [Alicyclobacillus curvatus]|nr:MFS transporter [Alicyclobacillus curvatus]